MSEAEIEVVGKRIACIDVSVLLFGIGIYYEVPALSAVVFGSADFHVIGQTVIGYTAQVVEMLAHVNQRHLVQFDFQRRLVVFFCYDVCLVLAGTAVFEIEACHDTFHTDISDIPDFGAVAQGVFAREIKGIVFSCKVVPIGKILRNILFYVFAACRGHQEACLVVVSSPDSCSCSSSVRFFFKSGNLVNPFVVGTGLFEDLFQLHCRIAEYIKIDLVFSCSKCPVAIVSGQCGFIDFLGCVDDSFTHYRQ